MLSEDSQPMGLLGGSAHFDDIPDAKLPVLCWSKLHVLVDQIVKANTINPQYVILALRLLVFGVMYQHNL
jgi:hypothetical protein